MRGEHWVRLRDMVAETTAQVGCAESFCLGTWVTPVGKGGCLHRGARQRAFDHLRAEYDDHRPQEALGNAVPAASAACSVSLGATPTGDVFFFNSFDRKRNCYPCL